MALLPNPFRGVAGEPVVVHWWPAVPTPLYYRGRGVFMLFSMSQHVQDCICLVKTCELQKLKSVEMKARAVHLN